MGRVISAAEPGLHEALSRVLGARGLVVMPCDTIYGIVGVAPETEGRIRSLKGRAETKPFIHLIPDPGWIRSLARVAPSPGILSLWPGPLTLILPAISGGTVALRLPDDELLRSLMREIGQPLYSTSVNRAGERPLSVIADIVAALGPLVDLIVDAGDRGEGIASTIVDLTALPGRVVRQGALRVPDGLLAG